MEKRRRTGRWSLAQIPAAAGVGIATADGRRCPEQCRGGRVGVGDFPTKDNERVCEPGAWAGLDAQSKLQLWFRCTVASA